MMMARPEAGALDHPRSRGVYTNTRPMGKRRVGSSPLARGLRGDEHGGRRPRRIIPARAGFTGRSSTSAWILMDHPRSRGVYPTTSGQVGGEAGSSPLARGLRDAGRKPRSRPGIIPARAGFTPDRVQHRGEQQDHPRSRGVYTGSPSATARNAGSSPLARGLRRGYSAGVSWGWIIPARAGFTEYADAISEPTTDHPRSRGVYSELLASMMTPGGSSPLARGLQTEPAGRRPQHRIIPARAGFTWPSRPAPEWPRDHPRSRGVYPPSPPFLTTQ